MRIRSLRFINWPGMKFDKLIKLGDQPIHLVVGSNGSGKSSFGRAVQGIFWPEKVDRHREIEAICEHDGTEFRAVLRNGSTTWFATDGSPQQLQPVGGSAHCHLLTVSDLLEAKSGSDQRLAESITKAMFGGINPVELRGNYKQAKRRAPQISELENCRSGIRRLITEEEDVCRNERGLEQLERRIEESGAAKELLARVGDAIELAAKTSLLKSAQAHFDSFEPAHKDLKDGDLDRVGALTGELSTIDEQVRNLESQCDQARPIAADPLQLTDVDQARLGKISEELVELRVAEQALDQAKEADYSAREELTQCRSRCLSLERQSSLSIGDVSTLQQILRKREEFRVEVVGMERLLNHMKSDSPTRSRTPLDQGIGWLQDWLAADAEGAESAPVDRRMMGVGLIVVGLGALLAFLIPWAAVLSLIGVGVIWKSQSAAAGPVSQERTVLEKNMAKGDLDGPKSWSRDAVGARLLQLLEERGQCITQEDRSKWLEAQTREIAKKSAGLNDFDSQCAEQLAELGLQPDLSSLEADVILRRVADLDQAEQDATKAASDLSNREDDAKKQAELIHSFLSSHVKLDGVGKENLSASAKALDDRWERADGARTTLDTATNEIANFVELRAKKVAVYDRIFKRLSLVTGDVSSLEALQSSHDAYLNARKTCDNAEFLCKTIKEKLDEHSDLLEMELDDLLETKRGLAEKEAEKDALIAERQSILDSVKLARKDSSLEAERGRESDLLDTLRTHRDEQIKNAMARAMIDQLLAHFNKEHAPDVLKHARHLFGQFTRGDYKLRVSSDEQASVFEAEDRTAEVYSLDTLSDGTRMQLLIAVRLAFAQHNEGNMRLPLILDEALSTSDPDRFEAVAEALFQLSAAAEKDGRQIIYMTANPNDVHVWNQLAGAKSRPLPNEVVLDNQTKMHMAAERARPLPPIRKPAPSAEGHDALSYRNIIGAPDEDHTDPQSLWLVYLLPNDLALVERLLNKRIETIGDWQTAVETGGAEEFVEDAARRSYITERCDSALRALADYAIGRGRSLTKEDLTGGGISRTMLERVWAQAVEANCNGNEFVARLRNPKIKIKSFKSGIQDELIAHLEQRRIYDPSPIRSETLEF